jgi:hypothetical protein
MAIQIGTAIAAIPRDSHSELNPVTGLYERATLLEDTRMNLLLRSQEFDNAAWSKANVTVTANAMLAPDGTLTADKIAATASAATSLTQAAVVAATAAAFSVYMKKGSGGVDGGHFGIRNATTSTDLLFFNFNFDTQAVTITTGVSGVTVQALANGWYRIIAVVQAGITSGNTVTAYAGFGSGPETAGANAYAWGAQLEAGAFATSYVATAGATVSRVADALSFPFPYTPQAMTVYVRHIERGTLSTGTSTGLIGIGASTNPAFFVYSNGGVYAVVHRRVADVGATALATPSLGALNEVRAVLYADGSVQIGQSVNGAAETVSAQSAANALAGAWFDSTLTINERGGGVGFNAFQAVKVLRGVHTLAEMRAA